MCSAPGLLPKNIVRAYLLELVPKKVRRRQKLVLQSSNGAPGLKTGCPAGCGAPQFLSACDSSSSVARRVRFSSSPDCRLADYRLGVEHVPAGLSRTGQQLGSARLKFIEPTRDCPINDASCAELDNNISTCRQWPPHDGGEQDSEAATAAPVARLRGGRRGRAAAPLLPRGPAARRAREPCRSTASNGDAR